MHPRKDFEIYGEVMTVKFNERIGETFEGDRHGQLVYAVGFPENEVGSFPACACAVIDRKGTEIPVMVPPAEYGGKLCYECDLRKALGDLILDGDILYPKFEKTCGAVMFTVKDGTRMYLVIKNESGHIGFPKGHIEYGESESETADREVYEETGLTFEQYGDFREEYTYTTRENTVKTGVFFIGKYEYKKPVIQEEEILDDWLVPYEKALELLNFPEDRALLKKAEKYISEREKNG
ncbi:MAG: NUDIX domain-containing protein [Ruminiclostridium sp.]|nr:NUDIX domain-containing protein [Ruminiclostridium sp.]